MGELAETVQRFKDDLGRLSATMQQRTSQKLRDQLQKQAQKGQMRPRQSSGGQMDGGQMRWLTSLKWKKELTKGSDKLTE